jgi:aspartate racemase
MVHSTSITTRSAAQAARPSEITEAHASATPPASAPAVRAKPSHGMPGGRKPTDGASTSQPMAPRSRAVIGVLGGMGPAAANMFVDKTISLKTEARSDQEHARVLLYQATNVPDRTAAIVAGNKSPVGPMVEGLKRLDEGGADIVAITCNTAHKFHEDLLAAAEKFGLRLELLHIVDATMKELFAQKPDAKRVGLLATSGTVDQRIYQERAEALGHGGRIEWVVPNAQFQARVMEGIYGGVKAGDNAHGKRELLAAAEHLKEQGVDAMLLACTEIPLVLKTGDTKTEAGEDIPMIDTLEALAKAALERADSMEHPRALAGKQPIRVLPMMTAFTMKVDRFLHGEAERPRIIGDIGGMGPAAAAMFSRYMVAHNESARSDQEHTRLLLDQATDIPDRTAAIKAKSQEPVIEMGNSLRRLAKAGATDIVMTCNTAHHFFPQLENVIRDEHLNVNLIHIVDATMTLLDKMKPGARKVGLLATDGTLEQKIYQKRAAEKGRELEWVVPDPDVQQKVMDGIYKGVKAGDNALGTKLLEEAAQHMKDKGVDAMLLACTEIPIALEHVDVMDDHGEPIPMVDTLEAQARMCIERAKEPIPATPGLLHQVGQLLSVCHGRAHEEGDLDASGLATA